MTKAKTISTILITTMILSIFAVFNSTQVNAKSYGYLKLKATSTNSHTYSSNQYSFTNTVFKVYKTNKKTIVKTIKAKNRKGETSSVKLPVGTYYIKEASIPVNSGYYANTSFKKIVIKKAHTSKKPLKSNISHKYKTASIRIIGKQKKYYMMLVEPAKYTPEGYLILSDGYGFYCPSNKLVSGKIAGKYDIKIDEHYGIEYIVKPGKTTTIDLRGEE